MNFSRFFIERPTFAIVLSFVIFVLGLIAIPLMPSAEYPEAVPPAVIVQATYPGANPKEIAESVAVPLEEAINGVDGVMYMKSVASSDGGLKVVVTFRPGVDPDTAAVRVQNRVSQALTQLPEAVRQHGVTTQKQSPTPPIPSGIAYRAAWDPTMFVRESIRAVQHTLIDAVILVVLVVILFLQSWRASIIPLVAVPVSVVGTFAGLYLLGYSINTLTLFGLVLAIGIVVDDAIVVVENVERNMAKGYSAREATHVAMREVSGPIIAIALVPCAVCVPMTFLSGVTGQFYKQFAVTIAISTVISAVNSLTLSPALAARLLRHGDESKDVATRVIDMLFGRLFRPFNRFFDRAATRYGNAVGVALQRRGVVFTVYLLLLGGTVVLFHQVPAGFIPNQDKLYLFAGAKLPEGASLARTDAVARTMVELAHTQKGVDTVPTYAGMNALPSVNPPNLTASDVILKPFNERRRGAAEINAELKTKFSGIKEGFAYALLPPPIQGLGNGSGYSLYLQDRAGLGYGALQNALYAFQGAIAQTPGMSVPVSAYQANIPQLEVHVDRTKAESLGVRLSDLFETLQVYLGSSYVNDFNAFGRVYRVIAQADSPHRARGEDISNLRVRTNRGEMIPIGSMVTVAPTFWPDPVIRYNGYPAADLIGDADPRVLSSGQVISKLDALAKQILPPGIVLEWTDLSYQQVTQGNASVIVFALAVMLVFLVLAALYESWTLPLAAILIVPVCMCAALFGVWLGGGDSNVFVQVGLVVLMGLACKNAILIVEFARKLELQGEHPVRAAVDACRMRLRPIVMTSVAFIAGAIPLLLTGGAGSEVRRATGVTVVAGMLGVTWFGLFLTPVFYVALRKLAGPGNMASAEQRDFSAEARHD